MAAMAQDAPPYTFVAKNGRVAWDTVLNFNVQPFFDGSNVSPRDLEALDEVARRVEEARIEPEPNVPADEMAARLAQLATVLQLSSEYQAMRAEVRPRRPHPHRDPTRSPLPHPFQILNPRPYTLLSPQDLQAAVQKKDEELDMMDEQIEAMEQQGGRSDVRLEQEANEARARAEEAERRVSLMGQELDVLKGQLDRAKEEVREEKRKVDEATRASRQVEDDVKELSEQLAAERQKQSSRQREEATSQQRAQQRNQEMARYQKENKLLAEENGRLNGKIESLMAECVNYSEMIVTMDDAAQAWRGREADVEAAA